ncbi:carotenoid oxygenase family protein [Coleofasciculus sp.]|uniref:carotenoid oxygenase family protein n=1 Tax=Coleofasciculus sp. TaxID=3100458 RepID=UPI0039F9562F
MSFKVTGRVYESESGLGIPNLIVEAFDKDIVKSDNLGYVKTNSQGQFEITYTDADFQSLFERFEGNPDLYIVVQTPDRAKIVYTSEKNVRPDASTDEYFDVPIPRSTFLANKEEWLKNERQLLKLLIGVAWIDGVLEPKELEFLQRVANEKGLTDDPEIKSLLSNNQPVPRDECYRWLKAYLGNYPSEEDFQELYEAFNSLMYSEGALDEQEQELIKSLSLATTAPSGTRPNTLQQRFMSVLMDNEFLANVLQMERSSIASDVAKGAGYYARVPYGILSRLSLTANVKALAEDMADFYLTDNFAPVKQEVTADNLTVIGELPQELSGMFLRNGPNPQFPPIGLHHWLDGDGMLHGVHISNGKASYRNRYIQTEGFFQEKAAGKSIWPGLLNLPRFDSPHGLMMKNTANTACVWHAGKLLALWEAGAPYQIRLPDLETVGVYTFNDKLASTFTAHPKVDAVTGEMIVFGFAPIAPPYLEYSVVSKEGELLRTVPIDIPAPVMMHDFAITENYTLFLDMPLTFRPMRIMLGQLPIKFEAQNPSRIGILPRHGDNRTIRWFKISTSMLYHVGNAWEEGDEVVLLSTRTPDTYLFIPQEDNGEGGDTEFEHFRMYRYRINLVTGAVKEELLNDLDVATEFPRINDDFTGRKTRYMYASRQATYMRPRLLLDGLIKYDVETGSSQIHEFGRGRFGGDSAFAPRPGGTAEDDGWLLTMIWDAVEKRSELWVIDAQKFTNEPVARILMPQRVPYGFHAAWISEAQMATQQS